MTNETAAGRLARIMPDLDARELRALGAENTARTYTDGTRTAARAIVVRAEDAAGMAGAKALPLRIELGHGRSSGQYGLLWSPAYWAAIP